MTIPTANLSNFNNSKHIETQTFINNEENAENIYQPIWKFKTVGEVPEDNCSEDEYYEISTAIKDINLQTTATTKASLSNESSVKSSPILQAQHADDYGEWETDDEFMFSSGQRYHMPEQLETLETESMKSTVESTSNEITLSHDFFRNICIFYSLTEPELRAIKYDYDRLHAWTYFANRIAFKSKNQPTAYEIFLRRNALKRKGLPSPYLPRVDGGESSSQYDLAKVKEKVQQQNVITLPDSVQAWKFMLLDVNYIEDEEDMNVNRKEMLSFREIKDVTSTTQTDTQLNASHRYKSASFANFSDLPDEETKKSLAERMRDKLPRRVFKLPIRSPKKQSRSIFRRVEVTSLCFDDDIKQKYPIFGASLEHIELNQTDEPNVPRFVIDCVNYIERRENICQDGLYRASGNKLWIDELKKVLSESYIYDARLLITDDIHTLTSLLKQFFRELCEPLIPKEIIAGLGYEPFNKSNISLLRKVFSQMREPNRSTLKFIIKHLTNVAAWSGENRMPASNLAIVWGPCLLAGNQMELNIGRMNTLVKILIEDYNRIFEENERLIC